MEQRTDQRTDQRSLGELFGDLSRSLSTLIRQEIVLARTEMTSKVTHMSRDAGIIGLGGALLYAAVLGLLATLVLLLVEAGLAPWLATLIVTIIVGVAGALMVAGGQDRLKKADLVPHRTVGTVDEDVEWAKERFR
ncbi:MAG: phage holin family protein [Chloroflexota bacterium]|jgi:hypothetical protein